MNHGPVHLERPGCDRPLRQPGRRSIPPSAIRRSSIDSRPPTKRGSARSEPRNRLDRRPLASWWGIRRVESVLSRQDRRGAGWGNRADVAWLVQVSRPGTCRITVRPCIEKPGPRQSRFPCDWTENAWTSMGNQRGSNGCFPWSYGSLNRCTSKLTHATPRGSSVPAS